MKEELRNYFDERVRLVIERLPTEVQTIIEHTIPITVEDYPSDEVMVELGIEYRDELCGMFTGTAITEKSVQDSGTLPDSVILYREGIIYTTLETDQDLPDEFFDRFEDPDELDCVDDPDGVDNADDIDDPDSVDNADDIDDFDVLDDLDISLLNADLLDEQIRITILHELGHFHGLDEDDLEELGYE